MGAMRILPESDMIICQLLLGYPVASQPTNLYPVPCTVKMNRGSSGLGSSFCRKRTMCASTVRVVGNLSYPQTSSSKRSRVRASPGCERKYLSRSNSFDEKSSDLPRRETWQLCKLTSTSPKV